MTDPSPPGDVTPDDAGGVGASDGGGRRGWRGWPLTLAAAVGSAVLAGVLCAVTGTAPWWVGAIGAGLLELWVMTRRPRRRVTETTDAAQDARDA